MRRKSVRTMLKSIGRLRKNFAFERERIVGRLAGRLVAPPGAARSYPAVLEHMEAELAALEADVAAAEDEYVVAKARARQVRSRRDEAAVTVHVVQQPLHRLLASVSERWSHFGIGSNPADPYSLVVEASSTIDFLHELERNPKPPVFGIRLDATAAARELETERKCLEAVIAELAEAESDVRFTQSKADAAIAHAKEVAPWVVQTIQGLAGLAQVRCVAKGNP